MDSFSEFESALAESGDILSAIEEILDSTLGIFSSASVGISMLFLIISAIVTGIIAIVCYILTSVPVYALAKKVGYKYAWLTWIPFFHTYCRLFVLCEIAGDKPFVPGIGNYRLENRKMSFLAYILIAWFGGLVVSVLITIISTVLPIIGYLSTVLALLPTATCAVIEYVYLRDILDLFKEDKKANNTAAIIVTAIDACLLSSLVQTFYLFTLMKRQPLPQKEVIAEEV